MNKSKGIFYILGFAYIGIAIGSMLSFFDVNGNVLLGLSISSLLISLGDFSSNIRTLYIERNNLNYSLDLACDILTNYINAGKTPQTQIDVYNVKKSLDALKTQRKAIMPSDYENKKTISFLNITSKGLFFLSIPIFIVVPFVKQALSIEILSQTITLFAFTFMCINIAINERYSDINQTRLNFENDKLLIIENAYPGYIPAFYTRLQHAEAYEKSLEKSQNETQQTDK